MEKITEEQLYELLSTEKQCSCHLDWLCPNCEWEYNLYEVIF